MADADCRNLMDFGSRAADQMHFPTEGYRKANSMLRRILHKPLQPSLPFRSAWHLFRLLRRGMAQDYVANTNFSGSNYGQQIGQLNIIGEDAKAYSQT